MGWDDGIGSAACMVSSSALAALLPGLRPVLGGKIAARIASLHAGESDSGSEP